MSTGSHQLDFLTFSPSLLQILSLLGLDDVIICKRVSHRFYGVIRGNSKSLPQEPIRLHIHTERKENSEDIAHVYVRAYLERYPHINRNVRTKWKNYPTSTIMFQATMTKQTIRLHECKLSSMLDHYAKQWKLMAMNTSASSVSSLPILDPELTRKIAISNREGWMDVPITSVKEELQYVLQSLLCQHSIEKVDLDMRGRADPQWNTPDELRDVIVDRIRERCLSRKLPDPSCDCIKVGRAWPRLDELCQLVDTRKLCIHTHDILLEGHLSYMLGWEHDTPIIQFFHTERYRNFIPFIRAWAEGSCRIKALWLQSCNGFSSFEIARVVPILRKTLPRCQIITNPSFAPGENEDLARAQIFIKRPADDVVLHMAYSIFYHFDFIIYEDVPETGKPLEFDDNMFNIR